LPARRPGDPWPARGRRLQRPRRGGGGHAGRDGGDVADLTDPGAGGAGHAGACAPPGGPSGAVPGGRRTARAGHSLGARVLRLRRRRERDGLFVNHAVDVIRSAAEQIMQLETLRRARLRVAENITDLIGDTPIVRLKRFDCATPGVEIWAKCEFMNPGGSVKDRAAYQMSRDAIRTGALKPGQTIIDSTSGNTGVAYALIGGALGSPVTLVMPGNVSWARRKITQAFGTELVFSDPMEGSDGAIRLCRKIVEENPGAYFYPDQYSNLSNPLGHYNTTGREIWEQTEGRVTHFVTGIGTTGTVMGTGRRLKEYRRDIEVYAAEPADSLHG